MNQQESVISGIGAGWRLSGFHANTHTPIVIGAQTRYEVTGDLLYKVIRLVTSSQKWRFYPINTI